MDAEKPYDGKGNLIEEIRCRSAEDFLAKINPKWDDIASPDFRDFRVYRGHGDAGWKLSPSAWRGDGKLKLAPLRAWLAPLITARMEGSTLAQQMSPDQLRSHEQNAVQVASEVYAVRQFCDLADELGLLIPQEEEVPELDSLISQSSLHHVKHGIFVDKIELFIDVPFAFAQHQGIPTRYLDWTRDPLVAAFFASENDLQRSISEDICVWAIDLREAPKVVGVPPSRSAPLHWVRVPRGQHGYLHAQSGIILFCEGVNGYQQPSDDFPNVQMTKYLLNRAEAKEVRKRLFGQHRYSKAHLMPTLDNVSKTVGDLWKWLPKK